MLGLFIYNSSAACWNQKAESTWKSTSEKLLWPHSERPLSNPVNYQHCCEVPRTDYLPMFLTVMALRLMSGLSFLLALLLLLDNRSKGQGKDVATFPLSADKPTEPLNLTKNTTFPPEDIIKPPSKQGDSASNLSLAASLPDS